MLQLRVIEAATLELLTSLQKQAVLQGFGLAGGTALAMYYGHRKSIDLDLFSTSGFDTERLLEQLLLHYKADIFHTAPNTLRSVYGY